MSEEKGEYIVNAPATIQEPPEAYHANPALSFTEFKRFMVSPLEYRAYRDQPADSAALSFGRLAHCLALEPEKFGERYAVLPDIDRRTKAGKEAYARFVAENAGMEIIKSGDYELAARIGEAARKRLPAGGIIEGTIRGKTEFGELQCRPDLIANDGTLWDLKTTASVAGFERQAFSLQYHYQDAFYRYVIQRASGKLPDPISFVASEKRVPNDTIVRRFGPDLYAFLVRKIEAALARYAECVKTDTWPGMDADGEVREMVTPAWVENEIGGSDVPLDIDALFGAGGE